MHNLLISLRCRVSDFRVSFDISLSGVEDAPGYEIAGSKQLLVITSPGSSIVAFGKPRASSSSNAMRPSRLITVSLQFLAVLWTGCHAPVCPTCPFGSGHSVIAPTVSKNAHAPAWLGKIHWDWKGEIIKIRYLIDFPAPGP